MKAATGLAQFEPWELEAFAEGGNSPHLDAFIRQHPDLWSSWLESYQRAQEKYALLHRFDCPSPDELRNYYWAMLNSMRHEQIAAHLTICLSCNAEFRTLEESMAVKEEPTVEHQPSFLPVAQLGEWLTTVVDQITWTIATLVTPTASTLATAALRADTITPLLDATHPSTLFFTTDDIDLNLIIQPAVDGTITFSGQILAASVPNRAQVKVASADPALAPVTVLVDEVGEFTLVGLAPGSYQLFLTLPDQVIIIPSFVLQL